MALAIFDLDETLIGSDSDHEWGQFISDRGLVDAVEHRRQNDFFHEAILHLERSSHCRCKVEDLYLFFRVVVR